jgi:hypothetical protein
LFSNPQPIGTVPRSLGQLTVLSSLKMHQTGLTGTVPTEFVHLTALQELLLDGTRLTGTLPCAGSRTCKSLPQSIVRVVTRSCCSCLVAAVGVFGCYKIAN